MVCLLFLFYIFVLFLYFYTFFNTFILHSVTGSFNGQLKKKKTSTETSYANFSHHHIDGKVDFQVLTYITKTASCLSSLWIIYYLFTINVL